MARSLYYIYIGWYVYIDIYIYILMPHCLSLSQNKLKIGLDETESMTHLADCRLQTVVALVQYDMTLKSPKM